MQRHCAPSGTRQRPPEERQKAFLKMGQRGILFLSEANRESIKILSGGGLFTNPCGEIYACIKVKVFQEMYLGHLDSPPKPGISLI